MSKRSKGWKGKGFIAALAAAAVAGGCAELVGDEDVRDPDVEATPVLRSLQVWQKEDYNTYPVARMLEQATGYKVRYEMLPRDNTASKLELILASGEAFDVITMNGHSDMKALYSDFAKKGALVDLGPLLDLYGPNIKAALSQESMDAVKIDGKLYAIPNRGSKSTGASLLIRRDWLDKLGLEMPTTLDEFVTVLQAFRDRDPGGNGDSNIPLTILGDGPFIDSLSGAFGLTNPWNEVDGKLVPRPLDPAYGEYVRFVRELYRQGLLEKEFVFNKSANVREKFTSGKAGVIPISWAQLPEVTYALQRKDPQAQWAYVPALKGKDGKMGLFTSDGFGQLTVIPKASKHPEDAIRWLNAKLEPETFKRMALGEEGKHYTFTDGAYAPNLPIFAEERGQAHNFLTGVDERVYPTYWQARLRKDPRQFEAWDYLNNKQPQEARIVDPLGLSPYLPTYSSHNMYLNWLINDQTVQFIVGNDEPDIETFVRKYRSLGGDASVSEVNAWYATAAGAR